MSRAPSYFEHVEGKPQLDVVEFDEPEEITVVEQILTDEQVEQLRKLYARETEQ